MTRGTRNWLLLSALGTSLLALDLGIVAVAAPHATAWLRDGHAAALGRAGGIALRTLESAGTRTATRAGMALVTRATGGTRGVYALILRASPAGRASIRCTRCPRAAGEAAAGVECDSATPAGAPLRCQPTGAERPAVDGPPGIGPWFHGLGDTI